MPCLPLLSLLPLHLHFADRYKSCCARLRLLDVSLGLLRPRRRLGSAQLLAPVSVSCSPGSSCKTPAMIVDNSRDVGLDGDSGSLNSPFNLAFFYGASPRSSEGSCSPTSSAPGSPDSDSEPSANGGTGGGVYLRKRRYSRNAARPTGEGRDTPGGRSGVAPEISFGRRAFTPAFPKATPAASAGLGSSS